MTKRIVTLILVGIFLAVLAALESKSNIASGSEATQVSQTSSQMTCKVLSKINWTEDFAVIHVKCDGVAHDFPVTFDGEEAVKEYHKFSLGKPAHCSFVTYTNNETAPVCKT